MHLLNVHTRQLQEFFERIPPYAILSHTWGEDEVLFQDLSTPGHERKLGYRKIEGCCQQAIRDGFNFVWVDTCCIDKRSSAELSEAINSMFKWYGNAQVCYVYLVDVLWKEGSGESYSNFRNSKWFTRGWTLQELIAPAYLKFFDKTWSIMFDLDWRVAPVTTVARMIEEITGIKLWFTYQTRNINAYLKKVPVATKLSWASGRHTARVEDMAYCLLGLLDVNMPLLYGEGHKAFLRLQEEFLKRHYDPTILCWGFGMCRLEIDTIIASFGPSCLAPTPDLFHGFRGVSLQGSYGRTPRLGWTVILRGLHIELPIVQVDGRNDIYIGVTDYYCNGRRLAIPLHRYDGSDAYTYVRNCGPFMLDPVRRPLDPRKLKWKTIYLDNSANSPLSS
ncbi:heterokaryon incompatibility protein-domain-containing protein [Xylaria cf. heliscus]|nr:heterokaryon incompatibility protein-domain-containing protein [Xylaria cf. heliscus]